MVEFWYSESIGKRPSMEDIHVTAEEPKTHWMLFAVCDGHGGCGVVRQLQKILAPMILKGLADATILRRGLPLRPSFLRYYLKQAIVTIDRDLHQSTKGSARGSGSTLVMIVYQPQTRQIGLVNVGDSRAVIEFSVQSDGETDFKRRMETRDHKPSDKAEALRVSATGSFIERGRVQGVLAMTRAMGDFALKKAAHSKEYHPVLGPVSALPDVQVGILSPRAQTTIILACDGIWDVMKSSDAIRIVNGQLSRTTPKTENKIKTTNPMTKRPNPAQVLVEEAYALGSSDNLSAIVVRIPPQLLQNLFTHKI